MLDIRSAPGERRARIEAGARARGNLWAIVLAGGESIRLRPLVRHLYGDDRPKQYAALVGDCSLLRQTLDRVARLIPPERTVVVTMARQMPYMEAELPTAQRRPHVLAQPEDRGTAAGILLAAHWIQAQDPEATVAVFPADHLVIEEGALMRHVEAVAHFVDMQAGWTILLGAQPTEPEIEYGWIDPGERVGWTAPGPVYRVHGFREKPSVEIARSLFATGALWNTLIFVARAAALTAAGRACLPSVDERLRLAAAFAGTRRQDWAIRHAYALIQGADFSHSMLEAWPLPLAVAKLTAITWCNLGTPRRVLTTLGSLGRAPAWASTFQAGA
jgi:mannose-1-phosphate guanylyltransferase